MLLFILNRNAAGCARVAHRAALDALPLVAALRRNDPRHGRALLRQHRRVGVEARPGIADQRMGALLRRGVEDDGRKEVHRITGFVGNYDGSHLGLGRVEIVGSYAKKSVEGFSIIEVSRCLRQGPRGRLSLPASGSAS